jgi:hypothetical protein
MRKASVVLNTWAYEVNEKPSIEGKGKIKLEYQTLGLSNHKPRSNLIGEKP